MEEFEQLLAEYKGAVERFVKFRLPDKAEAEDVLQEVFLTAYQKFGGLKNQEMFPAWIISIARNKCNDWFRTKAKCMELPYEQMTERVLAHGRHGVTEVSVVHDTLELLGDKDKQILYLYFFKELSQAEIAKRLNIPLGTVKAACIQQNKISKRSIHIIRNRKESV